MVAATNRDLAKALKESDFRADLYYRLAVFPIEVPPLRARRDDIAPLVHFFIARKRVELDRPIEEIPEYVELAKELGPGHRVACIAPDSAAR